MGKKTKLTLIALGIIFTVLFVHLDKKIEDLERRMGTIDEYFFDARSTDFYATELQKIYGVKNEQK